MDEVIDLVYINETWVGQEEDTIFFLICPLDFGCQNLPQVEGQCG